jgi:hypothetical protein
VAPGEFLKVGEMTYDVLGPGPLDYLPCRYDMSRLLFRGPKRNLNNHIWRLSDQTKPTANSLQSLFRLWLKTCWGSLVLISVR